VAHPDRRNCFTFHLTRKFKVTRGW
jgi:hypothetical protein